MRKIYFNGRWEEVSDEVFEALSRTAWATRDRARRRGECSCPKSQAWKCDSICPGCPFRVTGNVVSLDEPVAGEEGEISLGDVLPSNTLSVEDIVINQELNAALYSAMDRLSPEEKHICELMMFHSEREAAEILGMPRSTFKRRWSKIKILLRAELEDYY